jgi:glycosyltransferase involved in cell wall biosynthesis
MFSIGGIGVGDFSHGQPALAKLVARLAESFDVTFYSLIPTDARIRPAAYRLRAPVGRPWRLPVKGALWLDLLGRFLADHARSPYDALLSFWVYPMGTFVAGLARLIGRPSAGVLLGAELANAPEIAYGELRHVLGPAIIGGTCRALSALVAVSTQQLEALRRLGVQHPNVHLIPWGADLAMFPFAERRREPPLKILNVANISPVKDHATLVRAFALVRREIPAKLRIVGGGSLGPIRALVGQLGLSDDVELVGPVPHAAVPAHYAWADMFVLTSISEGQSGALADALASGVLAVTTPVGAALDLGEEVAVIVGIRDPPDLARKILAISADPEVWNAKVLAARGWAVTNDLDWTVERMAHLLRDLH